MKNLNITVANKVATYIQRDGYIVCGNSDYQITFTFDSVWGGYDKKIARFKWNGGYRDVEITTDNTTKVPRIENATQVEVGVYVEDLSTTTPAVIPCARSVLCGSASEYITPEEAHNLAERVEILENGGGTGSISKLYCHKYRVMLNGNGTFPEAYMNFAMYSSSADAIEESASDFLTQLKEKATIESIEVNLGEQEPALPLTGGVYPAMQRISVTYYTDIATMTTGILSTTNYKIVNRTITEV